MYQVNLRTYSAKCMTFMVSFLPCDFSYHRFLAITNLVKRESSTRETSWKLQPMKFYLQNNIQLTIDISSTCYLQHMSFCLQLIFMSNIYICQTFFSRYWEFEILIVKYENIFYVLRKKTISRNFSGQSIL